MTFQRIFQHIIDKAPQLAPRNTHAIHEWLANGYDTDKDIIPAIDQALKGGSLTIGSINYFTGFIRSFNERRVKDELKPAALTQQEKDTSLAKSLAWKRKHGKYLNHEHETFLNQFERENGAIAV